MNIEEMQQEIERLARALAVCHRAIDDLETENRQLRAASRDATFNQARVKYLEGEIEEMVRRSSNA
jgi:FtsZ-binding cell division protein ZapB